MLDCGHCSGRYWLMKKRRGHPLREGRAEQEERTIENVLAQSGQIRPDQPGTQGISWLYLQPCLWWRCQPGGSVRRHCQECSLEVDWNWSSCLDGYNGTIFAYGQTGSGKTYTMSGAGTFSINRLLSIERNNPSGSDSRLWLNSSCLMPWTVDRRLTSTNCTWAIWKYTTSSAMICSTRITWIYLWRSGTK